MISIRQVKTLLSLRIAPTLKTLLFIRLRIRLLLTLLFIFILKLWMLLLASEDTTNNSLPIWPSQTHNLRYSANLTINLSTFDVLVDNSERYQRHEVLAALPNLPSYYVERNSKQGADRSNCGRIPSLFDISFSNDYWQVLHSSNGTFYIYSAFFDNRTLVQQRPCLRILGMINRIKPEIHTHCQVWYESDIKPVVTTVVQYKYIWIKAYGNFKQGILQPYLITCTLPTERKMEVPLSVSLVEGRCDKAKNNLRVIHNLPLEDNQKHDFAVCVKGLDFSSRDNGPEVAEWLELLFLLGAHKVFMYDMGVHPNLSKVLRFYESLGRIEVSKFSLPGEQPNTPGLMHLYMKSKITNKRQNELIPYNDCLYRNMNQYKFIALLDTDEIIMPRSTTTWQELMKKVAPEVMLGINHTTASFAARNVYFLDSMQEGHKLAQGIPRFMKLLQHVYRAENYTRRGSCVKCFHDPQLVLTLHNHFPFSCLGRRCRSKELPIPDAHLQHYRQDCLPELRQSCLYFKNHTVKDTSTWRYKEPLTRNLLRTMKHLGYLKT